MPNDSPLAVTGEPSQGQQRSGWRLLRRVVSHPLFVLIGLGLLFFLPLLRHPTGLLYADYSDLLVQFVPAETFLVRATQETGELPLWCPYRFAGLPFLHDIQLEAFYPPHGVLYLLPPSWVGSAMSWLVVFHVLLAGLTMYAYARAEGLGTGGALVAGLGYMLAGRWLLHVLIAGHYVMVGLAWLPLVALALERAVCRRSLAAATGAGVAFALVALGTQPQYTLYAGMLVILWTFPVAWEEAGEAGCRSWRQRWSSLGRWLGYGAWVVMIAVGLSAVQLLPALEAAGHTTRSLGSSSDTAAALEGAGLVLLGLVGPALFNVPVHLLWEERTGLGLLWLGFVGFAWILGGRRTRFRILACGLLVAYALGGSMLLDWLPGLRLFRSPSRALTLLALPVAFFAGSAVEFLSRLPGPTAEQLRRCRRFFGWLTAAALILVVCGVVHISHQTGGQAIRWDSSLLYWLSLALTVPVAFWLLRPTSPLGTHHRLIWGFLLLVDVWALSAPAVAVRPSEAVYPDSAALRFLEQQTATVPCRTLDHREGDTPELLQPGAGMGLLRGIEAVRGYTTTDIVRYKEYLQFIGDKADPLEPLTSLFTHPLMHDFPIADTSLLDLLGVRYLVQPRDAPLPPALSGWRKCFADPAALVWKPDAAGGLVERAYAIYENPRVFPRAFVVPEAKPLPPSRAAALAALRTADLRRTVLLEDFAPADLQAQGDFRPATIQSYSPNHVVVETTGDSPGYLVLTDIWYPGWTAQLDDRPVTIHRADYLFRAVVVPAGTHQVRFDYQPRSFFWGKTVSVTSLLIVAAIGIATWLSGRRAARTKPGSDGVAKRRQTCTDGL